MLRKVLTTLVCLSLVFGVALSVSNVSAQGGKYQEAPSLAERVAKGELPAVDQRLPKNPLVIPVVSEVGTYGGTWRRGFIGPSDYNNWVRVVYDALLRFNATGDKIEPFIAESYSSNEDFTVWTVKLREGSKWSDGQPFTSADIMFWYNDVALNTEMSPKPPSWILNKDGSTAKVEAPDEVTVVFTYNSTNTAFPLELANKDGGDRTIAPFLPAHYMKQFHATYADAAKLNELITAGGFKGWTQLFAAKAFTPDNPERPAMSAWVPVTGLSDQVAFRAVRNPYFVGVDPEGHQLPYIEEVVLTYYADRETLNLDAIAGKIDLQNRHINTPNYPVFLENAEKNGYRVVNLPSFGGSFVLIFNLTFEDKDVRALYNTDAFRQGLSVAIDRAAINELAWLGLGEARQAVPPPYHPYYPGDEYAFAFTQYDVAMANKLLDEAGLTQRDGENFRLMPNGSPLNMVIEGMTGGQGIDSLEIIRQNWQAVGVRTTINLYERSLFFERSNANQHMMSFWQMDTSAFPFSANPKTQPSKASGISDWGRLWTLWYQSGGTSGEEPPQFIKDLENLHLKGQTVGPEEQVKIAQEIYRIWGKQLYHIGTIGMTPAVFIINSKIRNFPEVVGNDWPLRTPGNVNPEQLFYAQ